MPRITVVLLVASAAILIAVGIVSHFGGGAESPSRPGVKLRESSRLHHQAWMDLSLGESTGPCFEARNSCFELSHVVTKFPGSNEVGFCLAGTLRVGAMAFGCAERSVYELRGFGAQFLGHGGSLEFS
jgi:hypothetical protein